MTRTGDMLIEGRAHKFGDNIDTDSILPGRYLKLAGREAAAHVMEGIAPGFAQRVRPGDIIVAGSNFGCGSGRENATEAIKYAGIGAVIARSFSRLFFRSAINIGLPVLECPDAIAIEDGHIIEVDLASGHVHDLITGDSFHCPQMPQHVAELIEAGGLVPFLEKKLQSRGKT